MEEFILAASICMGWTINGPDCWASGSIFVFVDFVERFDDDGEGDGEVENEKVALVVGRATIW